MQKTDAIPELDTPPRFVAQFYKMEYDESTDSANCKNSPYEPSEDPVKIETPEELFETIGYNITEHMQTHRGEKRFQCSKCDYACAKRGNLTRHLRKHTGEKAFHCIVCDYACTKRCSLQQHMKTHSEEALFKCLICEYSTTAMQQLEIHTRTHNEQKQFICPYCDYACTRLSTLQQHVRTHTERSVFKCTLCDYSTATSKHLDVHTRTHIELKQFKCNVCDYASAVRRTLDVHMRVHTGEKPFQCTFCDYACNQHVNLKKHLKTHTGEKAYKCDVCDYACTQKFTLTEHMRMHTGERPYQCKICDYASPFRTGLVQHMARHTDEKAFLCNICGYATATRGRLTQHMTSHTGELKIVCTVCGLTITKHSLKRHMRTHTKEKPSKRSIKSAEDLKIVSAIEQDSIPTQKTLKKSKLIVMSPIRNIGEDDTGDIDYTIEEHSGSLLENEIRIKEMEQTMNHKDGVRNESSTSKEMEVKCKEVSPMKNITEDDIGDVKDTNVVDSDYEVKVEVTVDEITPTVNQSDGLRDEIVKSQEETKKCKEELVQEVRKDDDVLAAVDALQKELEEREKLWMEEKRMLEDRIYKLKNQKTEK